jgi:hypothetical protein
MFAVRSAQQDRGAGKEIQAALENEKEDRGMERGLLENALALENEERNRGPGLENERSERLLENEKRDRQIENESELVVCFLWLLPWLVASLVGCSPPPPPVVRFCFCFFGRFGPGPETPRAACGLAKCQPPLWFHKKM